MDPSGFAPQRLSTRYAFCDKQFRQAFRMGTSQSSALSLKGETTTADVTFMRLSVASNKEESRPPVDSRTRFFSLEKRVKSMDSLIIGRTACSFTMEKAKSET